MHTIFGCTAPYTVGVEEEFQLTDPVTGALSPAIDSVLRRLMHKSRRISTAGLGKSFTESGMNAKR